MRADRNTKLVTARFGNEAAKTLAGYQASGGYQVVRKALAMAPDVITSEVKASNLRGRGGAGSRPASSGASCPRTPRRSTSYATPTSPSPARARIGCSCTGIRTS